MEDVIEKEQDASEIIDDVKKEVDNTSPESIYSVEEWISLLKKNCVPSIYDYYL